MCSELKELLDAAIFRAGLNKKEVLMLEKKFKEVYYVDDFIKDVYDDSDEIASYLIKPFSFAYIKYYLQKDNQKGKIFKAKDLLKNEKILDKKFKTLLAFARSIYKNEQEQILYLSQYV